MGPLFHRIVSAGFAGLGIFIIIKSPDWHQRLMGATCVIFFGGGGLLLYWLDWHKKRSLTYAGASGVTIAGGVPLRMKRKGLLAGVLGAAALGLFLTVGGVLVFGWLFAACGLFIFGGSSWLAFLFLTGRRGSDMLVFEPQGLRWGVKEGSVLIAWDEIARCELVDFQHNLLMYVWLRNPATVIAAAETDAFRERLAKQIGRTQQWNGTDLVFHPMHFGVDAMLMVKAVDTYRQDPSARERLVRGPEFAPPGSEVN